MKVVPATAEVIEQYPELSDGGTVKNLKGLQVPLPIGDDNPVFMKARVVSFSIQKRYEEALENLKEDISEKTLNGSHQQSP